MNVADIQSLHTLVWSYRKRLSNLWPTPNREDSLAFAFTEIGEAVDAKLRQNPIYNRNHDKNINVENELADCLIMLLTALGEEFKFTDMYSCFFTDLPFLAVCVTELFGWFSTNESVAVTCYAITHNEIWNGFDIYGVVWNRLDRIEKRVTCAN